MYCKDNDWVLVRLCMSRSNLILVVLFWGGGVSLQSENQISAVKQHRSNQISWCCSLYSENHCLRYQQTKINTLIKLRDSRQILLSSVHTLPEQISEIIKKDLKSLDTTWEGQYFLKCLLSRFLKILTHSLFTKERKGTKTGHILWKGP